MCIYLNLHNVRLSCAPDSVSYPLRRSGPAACRPVPPRTLEPARVGPGPRYAVRPLRYTLRIREIRLVVGVK